MVGGKVIDITRIRPGEVRLWCVDTHQYGSPGFADECAVHVAEDPSVGLPALNDTIWWQAGVVYFDGDRKQLRKIGDSYDPRRSSE